ncbi:MAG: ABC transporter ATP-binding protein [Oscillospiraceae bacterium]|nr:ABC transporter ATP-binding protein [Oscillospiraceae bacterium]
MLEIKNLTAGYAGKPVLQNLSLTIPAGQVTAVVGPNGCGKSTLLKVLAGILPGQGSLLLQGQALDGLSSRERAQKIAYLPQNRTVPEITAGRLVLHGRFPYLSYPRRYRQEDYGAAERAMARLDILDLKDRDLTTLSGGQRQKVCIAMVLAQDTPVVLLDEPNTYLDIAHQLQMMAQAKLLAAEGKAVVLVLHDLAMALETADQLAVMENGTLLCQGDAETVFASGALRQAFGVAVNRIQTPDGWRYYCTKA